MQLLKLIKLSQSLCVRLGIVTIALASPSLAVALPLSPGDRLEVSIPDDSYFSRAYEVNQDGELEVPYLGRLAVSELEPAQVEEKLSLMLIEKGFFLPETLLLSIQILQWAPVQVNVAGEVFRSGRVLINEPDEPQQTAISSETRQITGDYPPRRYLTTAIRAAGGVLPTADVKKILLLRSGQQAIIDLSGVFTGEPIEDVPLIAGDRIIVPTAERFQPELARPSQITPPGIKVFVSNLTVPATSNATSAIGNREEGITFPYGARFSQAVISTNCAGGTQVTNASRRATLVRVNRLTGKTTAFDRSIEDLLRDSNNEADNPLLMPRDGVACYDSAVTNIRDVFRTIGEILNPLNPLNRLFGL